MIVPKRQLLDDIRAAISRLGSPGAPGLTLASAAADLFEVFIFYIVLDEAINAGAQVWLKPSSAGPPPTVAFRTSPGCITATDSYTYALLTFTRVGSPHINCRWRYTWGRTSPPRQSTMRRSMMSVFCLNLK